MKTNAVGAAERVLSLAKRPLKPEEIAARARRLRIWKSESKTPGASIGAAMYMDIVKNGRRSSFRKASPGTFARRR